MINNKTGAGTFAVVLALTRIFAEAASLSDESAGYGMQHFTVTVVSFVLALAAFIPLLAVHRATDGNSPLAVIAGRSKLLSGFFGILLSACLLMGAADTGLRAHSYAASTVFDSAPSVFFYIFTGAALIFAVYKGFEAVTRAGVVTAMLLALLLVLITAALAGDMRFERLYPALVDDPDTLWGDIRREFSLNTELFIFTALYGNTGGKRRAVPPLYIGISCAVLLFMTLMYNTVLGHLTSRLKLPFYTLSSISDIVILHRINGIDAAVWVMAGLIRAALFALAFGETIKTCFGGERFSKAASVLFAAGSLALSAFFTAHPDAYAPLRRLSYSGIPLVAAAVLIPAAALICTIGRKGRKEQ